jgi:hypothetical protein
MSNRFRDPAMRMMYESCIDSGRRGLWIVNGQQRRGSSHSGSFWDGFNGVKPHYLDQNSLGWAAWRAGQDYAKEI